jgi:S-adenosylmethionine:tRNA ribosyltransferase-isomerase
MIAANRPVQRPPRAKLLVVDARGRIAHTTRSAFVNLLRPGDLVIANDAATLPASLRGVHLPSGAEIEVRLAGRGSLAGDDVHEFTAVVFGAGDFRARTEDRPLPPPLAAGDRLALGPLSATVEALLDHPRLVSLRFDGKASAIWDGLARHGRPIQYAHVTERLALWDVWTPIASLPVAFEPPSAGFALDWRTIRAMRERGIAFVTITHAAGISSTGDAELDRRLPFDEAYRIPEATAAAIWRTKAAGGRIVAVGTTVVRALEHAAACDDVVRAGEAVATGRIGPNSRVRIVDAILSGTHEPGSSHYELLRAFVNDATLGRASAALKARGYRTHEFGDFVFVVKPTDSNALFPPRARVSNEIQGPALAPYVVDENARSFHGRDRVIGV